MLFFLLLFFFCYRPQVNACACGATRRRCVSRWDSVARATGQWIGRRDGRYCRRPIVTANGSVSSPRDNRTDTRVRCVKKERSSCSCKGRRRRPPRPPARPPQPAHRTTPIILLHARIHKYVPLPPGTYCTYTQCARLDTVTFHHTATTHRPSPSTIAANGYVRFRLNK